MGAATAARQSLPVQRVMYLAYHSAPNKGVLSPSLTLLSGCRFVNGFSKQDWLLALLFRSTSGFIRPAAGICEVAVPGIENVELEMITGQYRLSAWAGK